MVPASCPLGSVAHLQALHAMLMSYCWSWPVQARDQLTAMWDDCMEDMMDQLWEAFTYAGTTHIAVTRMANAMAQRDVEVVGHKGPLGRPGHACGICASVTVMQQLVLKPQTLKLNTVAAVGTLFCATIFASRLKQSPTRGLRPWRPSSRSLKSRSKRCRSSWSRSSSSGAP